MEENLIKHVMEDPEVVASGATSYQVAQIIACVLDFIRNQPERSKREDSFNLSNLGFYWDSDKQEMRCSEHDSNAVREVQ